LFAPSLPVLSLPTPGSVIMSSSWWQ